MKLSTWVKGYWTEGIIVHIVKLTVNWEDRPKQALSLPLTTEHSALCSLRQAERNPDAHHKDCTISQLAAGAGQ